MPNWAIVQCATVCVLTLMACTGTDQKQSSGEAVPDPAPAELTALEDL